jgi:subtilase family serine protease
MIRALSLASRPFALSLCCIIAMVSAAVGVAPAGGVAAAQRMAAVGTRVSPPAGARDLGPARGTRRIRVDVALKPRDPAALSAFVGAVSTPGSALYRHYLAQGQFASVFAPTPAAIAAVRSTLIARGLDVGSVSSDGLVLSMTATAGQIQSAFGATMHVFRLASGRVVEANVSAPVLPARIAPLVEGVVGLDGFFTYQPASLLPAGRALHIAPAGRLIKGQPAPCSSAIHAGGATGPNIAAAYDMDPFYNAGDFGAGRSIDLFELGPYDAKVVIAYEHCYHAHTPIRNVPVDGGATGPPRGEDEVDIEDIMSLAPKAKIFVYESTPSNGLDQLIRIAGADNAKVVSISWLGCENTSNKSFYASQNDEFKVMAAQGQSVFVASGDHGSECYSPPSSPVLNVGDPPAQPDVTAVGGTVLKYLGNPPGTAPTESAWSAGGGGISSVWRMQPWQLQSTPGVINSYSTGSLCGAPSGQYCRELPDVSANAGVGYDMYVSSSTGNVWKGVAGTSLASPTWAAITILTDDSTNACRAHPVGFLNPALYRLAVSTPADFNDITTGTNDNGNPAANGAYPATKGYDMATGLGTPAAANLAQSLCGASLWTPPAAVSTAVSYGAISIAASGPLLYAAFDESNHVMYAMTYDGFQWSAPAPVAVGGFWLQALFPPTMAVVSGHPVLVWTDVSSGKVEVSTSNTAGLAWSKPVVIAQGVAKSSATPAVAVANGALFVVYKGKTNDKLYYSFNSGRGWSKQAQMKGAVTPYAPSIVFPPSSLALVVAWTTKSRQMARAYLSIFGPRPPVKIPGHTNAGPALAVLGSRLYVAWKGIKPNDVFYSSASDAQNLRSWTPERTIPGSITKVNPSLTSGGATLYAAWTNPRSAHPLFSASDQPQLP